MSIKAVWFRQSNWPKMPHAVLKHVAACVTEIRGHPVTFTQLERERERNGWNPYIIVLSVDDNMVGMARTATPNAGMLQWTWPLASIPDYSKTIIIQTVCILKKYRGRGYANSLMQMILEKWPNRQMALAVLRDNAIARKLYHKYKFRVFQHRDDTTFMVRK